MLSEPWTEMCQVVKVLQDWAWPLARLCPTGLPGKEAVCSTGADQKVDTAHQHHVGAHNEISQVHSLV